MTSRSQAEFIVKTASQYDSTCRELAQAYLDKDAEVTALRTEVEKVTTERELARQGYACVQYEAVCAERNVAISEVNDLKTEYERIKKLRDQGCSICQRPFRFQEEIDAGVCAVCVLAVKDHVAGVELLTKRITELTAAITAEIKEYEHQAKTWDAMRLSDNDDYFRERAALLRAVINPATTTVKP